MPDLPPDLREITEEENWPTLAEFNIDQFEDVHITSMEGMVHATELADDERGEQRRESKVGGDYLQKQASEYDVTPFPSSRLLFQLLRSFGPLTRRDLKFLLKGHRTTVDRAIGQLRELDILVESPHPQDGRKKVYTIPEQDDV